MRRTPPLNFTEDISHGNDPVYVFGERLRERQFTQPSLMAGAIASTFLSWPTIPILYYTLHSRKAERIVGAPTELEGVLQ